MPNPDDYPRGAFPPQMEVFFAPSAVVVPPVPAVHLTREQYDGIKRIVQELRDIKEQLGPRPVETALLDGKAFAEIIEIAAELYLP